MHRKVWSYLVVAVLFVSLEAHTKDMETRFFGYLEGYVEKVEKQPQRSGGSATTEGLMARTKQPSEFNTPNVNAMLKSTYKGKYSGFLNLTGADGGGVSVQNAWVESKLVGDHLKFRFGKLYRRFGLYNELLDAVPTYIGIEPPELFDGDHLLLTRTTNVMFHGEHSFDVGILKYALTTGNDERFSEEVPLGGDVRFTYFGSDFDLTFGTSFYFSNQAKPARTVGNGSPTGAVPTWMKSDKYEVLGFYTELNWTRLKFQFAYFNADHDAVRSGTQLQNITSGLNEQQIARLCAGNCATASDSTAQYDVKTWYVRAGYSFNTGWGEVVPYLQWDVYENPETIASKTNGGDNEAGLADDGKFTKQTIGVVYRPYPVTAFKLDGSRHDQTIDGKDVPYSEVRFSYSYVWSL